MAWNTFGRFRSYESDKIGQPRDIFRSSSTDGISRKFLALGHDRIHEPSNEDHARQCTRSLDAFFSRFRGVQHRNDLVRFDLAVFSEGGSEDATRAVCAHRCDNMQHFQILAPTKSSGIGPGERVAASKETATHTELTLAVLSSSLSDQLYRRDVFA